MTRFYLFCRCWIYFRNPSQFAHLNCLSDDEVESELEQFAHRELFERWDEGRALLWRRYEALERQSKRVLPGSKSSRPPRTEDERKEALERQSERGLRIPEPSPPGGTQRARYEARERFRKSLWKSHRYAPFACQVGAFFGWFENARSFYGDRAVGPRVWLFVTETREVAEQIVAEWIEFFAKSDEGLFLKPQFGILSRDELSRAEQVSAQRQASQVRRGYLDNPRSIELEDRSSPAEVNAAIAREAVRIAQEVEEPWGDVHGTAPAEAPATETAESEGAGSGGEPQYGLGGAASVETLTDEVEEAEEENGGRTQGESPKKPAFKLRPCDELARNQYNFAMKEEASLTTDRQVYDWLSESKSIDQLPKFPTWTAYLRKARRAYGESKNTLKAGNPTRSVVPSAKVESEQRPPKRRRRGDRQELLDRLGSLAGDLCLAGDTERPRLWNQAAGLMRSLGVAQDRITALESANDWEGLARLHQELGGGS